MGYLRSLFKRGVWDTATELTSQAHSNTLLPQYLPSYLRQSTIYASLPPSPSTSPSSQPFQPPSPRRRSSLLKLFSPSSADANGTSATAGSIGSVAAIDPPHLMIAAALAGDKARSLSREMHRIRSVKSPNEIALMKQAADLAAEAHTRVSGGVNQPDLVASSEVSS